MVRNDDSQDRVEPHRKDQTAPCEEEMQSVPVGLEQVLFAAACNRDFRQALLRDRDRAVEQRDFVLLDTERAVLRAVSPAQLEAMIGRLDTSSANLERRDFMRAVAATFVGLAAGAGLSACGDKTEENPYDAPLKTREKPEHLKQFDAIKKAIAKEKVEKVETPPARTPDASVPEEAPAEDTKPAQKTEEPPPKKKTKKRTASPRVEIPKKSTRPRPAGILSEKQKP